MIDQERALLGHIDSQRDTLVGWTRELVAIPTVNPYSGDDSAGSEAAGQDWIEDRFGRMGASVRRVPVPPDVYEQGGLLAPEDRSWDGRDNVVAEWVFGDGTGPTILLNNHMDTVGTEGMEIAPFDPVVSDGKLFGRGSSDTKGNMAMGLAAVAALQHSPAGLNGRIVFESVVDEECNGGGAGTLACCLDGVTGDFAICLDGVAGALHNGCNGIVTPRIVVRGRGGHSAWGEPVNALDKAVVVKQAVDAFAAEHRQAYPNCEGKLTVLHCGTVAAIVPNRAEMQGNMSYDISEAKLAQRQGRGYNGVLVRERFEQAMAELARTDPWFGEMPVEVAWTKDSLPYLTDPADPFVRTAADAATAVLGRPPEIKPIQAWFDGSHLANRLGIPVVSMGMGTPGTAHSAGEYVLVDDLVAGAGAVALTLCRLLGEPASDMPSS